MTLEKVATVFVALTLRDNAAVAAVPDRWAVLEGEGLSLVRCLDQCLADGISEVRLIGVFTRKGAAPQSWLRRVAGQWLRDHEEPITICVRSLLIRDVSAETRREAAQGPWRLISGREAPLVSPTWEETPGFRHHALICTGIRCNARGADAVAAAFSDVIAAHHATDNDVLITRTLCQYPCNQGPIVTVYPDNVWHSFMTPEKARALAVELCESVQADDSVPTQGEAPDHQ